VTTIGRCAFYGYKSLCKVTLPDTLETIGAYAFYNCTALKEITVPENVTEIGIYAFRKCYKLKDMTFEIAYGWSAGDKKFSKSEMLSSGAADYLVISNYRNVWTRDINAEDEIIDPNYVDGGMCGTNVKWTLIKLENGMMKLSISGNGKMTEFSTAGAPWYKYAENIVEVEITEGVTSVGRCAFFNLKKLEKVTLCDSITVIGDYAFNTCWKLKEIEIPAAVTKIGKDAFVKTGVTL